MQARLRRRVFGGLAVLSMALVTALTLGGGALPAQAATGSITGYGGKCVDVAAANSANGAQVQLFGCNGTNAQSWDVRDDGTVRALGKCLDAAGGSSANGTRAQLWDCNGTAAQRWTAGGDGTLRVLGKCLDATGPSSADGTPLQLWDCTAGAANQRWTLPTGGGNPQPNPAKMPAAPYLYLGWGNPPSATSVMSQTGIRAFTMAFILSSGGCNPAWDGSRPLTGGVDQQTINAIKAAGGQVQISFGGWSGNKLGPNCSTPAAFAGAVQQVIDAHQPNVVDFDIENSDEFENTVVQDRILQGLIIVKQNNPDVKIAVTIGTGRSGPEGAGTRLINRAAQLGVGIDNYTIMPFNFGSSNIAQDTINAAEGLKNQLKAANGWTDAQAYAHMGISGMNGSSDQGEVTTTAAWTQIRDYARNNGLTRFAFWSVNRDQPGYEFTRITAGF